MSKGLCHISVCALCLCITSICITSYLICICVLQHILHMWTVIMYSSQPANKAKHWSGWSQLGWCEVKPNVKLHGWVEACQQWDERFIHTGRQENQRKWWTVWTAGCGCCESTEISCPLSNLPDRKQSKMWLFLSGMQHCKALQNCRQHRKGLNQYAIRAKQWTIEIKAGLSKEMALLYRNYRIYLRSFFSMILADDVNWGKCRLSILPSFLRSQYLLCPQASIHSRECNEWLVHLRLVCSA